MEEGTVELAFRHISAPTARESRRGLYLAAKRALDIVVSLFALIVLSPLLLGLALLISIDSPGPALFIQQRVGYDRRRRQVIVFGMYKFRSMYRDSDQSVHRAWVRGFVGSASIHGQACSRPKAFDLSDDSRITRMGRLLRRTSIDELPQLWNVLRGDMSLVGPRPVPVYEVAQYKPCHLCRLAATPGITGLWQVKARGTVALDEWVKLDVEYIANQSLPLDLKILFLTIPAVISGRGAV